jgi:hypothetical protein
LQSGESSQPKGRRHDTILERFRQFYDLALRWSASHQQSLAPFLVELTAIHAEAGAVLGLRQPAQMKDKKPAHGKNSSMAKKTPLLAARLHLVPELVNRGVP